MDLDTLGQRLFEMEEVLNQHINRENDLNERIRVHVDDEESKIQHILKTQENIKETVDGTTKEDLTSFMYVRHTLNDLHYLILRTNKTYKWATSIMIALLTFISIISLLDLIQTYL